MQKERFNQLGWVVAAALGAVMFASGFQDTQNKFAVVDIPDLVEKSNFGKQNQDTFNQMKKTREDLLEFVDTNRMLTNEQAQTLRDLTLKSPQTPDDKAKIASIQADVVASRKKSDELALKTNPTPEDRTLMDDYAKRSQNMAEVARRWYQEFMTEMQGWADKQKLSSIDRARAAVQEVAKQQGYTVVFESSVVPYCANDITGAALTAMNAKG
jgi:Skp family chaperone for outer membrane proteins